MQQQLTIPTNKLMDLNTYIDEERASKWGGAAIKKALTQQVMMYAKANKLKPMKLPISILITFYKKNKRVDRDNLLINTKWILDGLVAAGVIANDGWDAIWDIGFDWKIGTEEMINVLLENSL